MHRAESFSSLAWLFVRLVLALILVFAAVGVFEGLRPANTTVKPWIGANAPSVVPPVVYAVCFGVLALMLVAGWKVPLAALASSSALIVVTVERLVRNPFTNLAADIALIMGFAVALLLAGPDRDRWSLDAWRKTPALPSVERWSWVTLFLRVFIGAIFFMQGFRKLFLGAGPITFAERLYVKPFAGMMPEPLLWIAGVSNPFLQFGVGTLLTLGLFTRSAATVGALFLVSIIFGHLMEGGLTAPGRMRDAGTANFIAMIAVMLIASRGNRWNLDHLLFRDRRAAAPE